MSLEDAAINGLAFIEYPRLLDTEKINGYQLRYASVDQNSVCMEFDLRAPIAPQIEKAKRLLNFHQEAREIKPRNNEAPRMFPKYLRVLDAIAEGAAMDEVGVCLQAGHENLQTWIAKAEELRDGGYRRLLEK